MKNAYNLFYSNSFLYKSENWYNIFLTKEAYFDLFMHFLFTSIHSDLPYGILHVLKSLSNKFM